MWGEFTGEFHTQRASNAEYVSIWRRHHTISWKACNFPVEYLSWKCKFDIKDPDGSKFANCLCILVILLRIPLNLRCIINSNEIAKCIKDHLQQLSINFYLFQIVFMLHLKYLKTCGDIRLVYIMFSKVFVEKQIRPHYGFNQLTEIMEKEALSNWWK